MEIVILYICLQLILFLLIFTFVEIRGIRKLIDNYIIKQQNDVAIPQDAKDEFLEEDKKKAADFFASIATLNSFMTGQDYTEEINDVGKQET